MRGLSVLRREQQRRDRYAGTVIDGLYLVRSRIGGGGEGAVYEAVTVDGTETPVALKIRFERGGDGARWGGLPADPLLREFEVLNALRGPYFPRPLRYGQTDCGHTYLTREFIRGIALDQLCRRDAPLRIGRAGPIVLHTCDALLSLHAQGFLHRDLKPGNIVVGGAVSEPASVKLLDYGSAWPLGAQLEEPSRASHVPSGTPAYMAPEQARGAGDGGGPGVDLYGVGALTYELLTGRQILGAAAASATTALEYLRSNAAIPAQPLGPLRPDLPSDLTLAITRSLARDPATRGDSIAGLRAVLAAAVPTSLAESWDPSNDSRPSASRDSWVARLRETLGHWFGGGR